MAFRQRGTQEEMPTFKVKLSDLAIEDLVKIEDYTAKIWGEAQAKVYVNKLKERIYWLAGHAMAGKKRDEPGKDLYSFPEERHIIFYRLNGDMLEVARVLHQSMDIEHQFT